MDERLEQVLAHRGIFYVTIDGVRQAWNGEPGMKCPVCLGRREVMPTCDECRGTGMVLTVPFCPRPWDEILPGVFLGGHDHQPFVTKDATRDQYRGDAIVHDEFDLVISLYSRYGWGPDEGVRELRHVMADAELDPDHHDRIDELAEEVVNAFLRKEKVLVRCQAGMNRSALVLALAMLKMGWQLDFILLTMRQKRSPYVLFNEHFVAYLREVEARA